MAIREDWKLGANGCRGASWSDERFGAISLTAIPRCGLLLSGGLRTSRTQDNLQKNGTLKSVLVCCCSSNVICHMTVLCV